MHQRYKPPRLSISMRGCSAAGKRLMAQDTQQLESIETPDANLFERIVFAVRQEQEVKQSRKLLLLFLTLLIVSAAILPFSYLFLASQWHQSGVSYFISIALENAKSFVHQWQDFSLSIFEALPIAAMVMFLVNVFLLLFSIRLFLYKRGAIMKYFKYSFI